MCVYDGMAWHRLVCSPCCASQRCTDPPRHFLRGDFVTTELVCLCRPRTKNVGWRTGKDTGFATGTDAGSECCTSYGEEGRTVRCKKKHTHAQKRSRSLTPFAVSAVETLFFFVSYQYGLSPAFKRPHFLPRQEGEHTKQHTGAIWLLQKLQTHLCELSRVVNPSRTPEPRFRGQSTQIPSNLSPFVHKTGRQSWRISCPTCLNKYTKKKTINISLTLDLNAAR